MNSPTRRRVLVVDDDESTIDLVMLILERGGGYEAIGALGGLEGVRVAQKAMPDLVILDDMMPDLHGYEVFSRIREIPGLEHIPILFMTADQTSYSKKNVQQLGAAGHIAKPFGPKELLRACSALLKGETYYPIDQGGILGLTSDGPLGSSMNVTLTRTDEALFLEFLRSKGDIKLIEHSAPSMDELLVDEFAPELANHRIYYIWNQQFPWTPTYGRFKVDADREKGIECHYVTNLREAPVIEFHRSDVPGKQQGWLGCKHGNDEEFTRWYNSIVRWLEEHKGLQKNNLPTQRPRDGG